MKWILAAFLLTSLLSCERRYNGGKSSSDYPTYIRNNRDVNIPRTNTHRKQDVASLYKRLTKSVFLVYGVDKDENIVQGSAFFIRENKAITNYHVIDDPSFLYLALIDGEPYEIKRVIRSSPTDESDYAIFEIDGFYGKPLKIARKRPEIGDEVFAIGSPSGLENSLTTGNISGIRGNYLQIDATIDHGSSGGALFNMDGEVIGITRGGQENGKEINFAIDIQAVNLKGL